MLEFFIESLQFTRILGQATVVVEEINSIIQAGQLPPNDVITLKVTRQMKEVGKTMAIDLLDHIIIGGEKYISLRDRGLM